VEEFFLVRHKNIFTYKDKENGSLTLANESKLLTLYQLLLTILTWILHLES